jgi:molybdate transport system substrate-binding protein
MLVCFAHFPSAAQSPSIRVAAASDLKFAMDRLIPQFEKQTGAHVAVTYGSSGNFFSQIQNGAPFDLFFSADLDYPRKLEAADLILPGSLYQYAVGRLAIWIPLDVNVDLAHSGWNALLDPRIQKIAIANPDHAPYGRAAVAALHNAGIYDRVKSKLVFGENISQAAQFVQSGSAQAGILSLSLVISPGMKDGKRWDIPTALYPPLDQAAIILKNSHNLESARAFLAFIKSPAARLVLEEFGFSVPAPTQQPSSSSNR